MSTSSETSLKRTERITRVADLCPALATALQKKGLASDQVFLTFRNCVSLECAQCGTLVPGEDLYVLSQPAEGHDVNTGLRRLRLGFCPNPICKSYDCTITFKTGENLDWTACLRRADRFLQDLEDSRAGRGKRWRSELIRPMIISVSGILLLLLFRQLYFGGRIPLLREPEKFRVDPAPVMGYPH